MVQKALNKIQNYLQIDAHDAKKLILSTITFFLIIGAYSILRSLKTSIFLAFVGIEFEPISKLISIVFTIPAMILHTKITDQFKKHQVVYAFIGFYAVLILIFAWLFMHPVYGVSNTITSPYRVTGWAFEIIMDLFQALIVGTFWSFINSICTPFFASNNYGIIIAGSRVGGILTTASSWYLLEKTSFTSAMILPLLTFVAGILLLFAVICIYFMQIKIPSSHMHGYEATYRTDLQQERRQKKTNVFEGFTLLLTQPYVFGIFGLVFSYEIINIIFDYQMHVLMASETNNHIGGMSSYMLLYTGSFQALSLLFALFGTSPLVKHFGVQRCLIIMPLATLVLACLPVLYPKLALIFAVMVVLRALNYGFNHPLREILFIPTVKDIRFKSKAWIESFGRTFSKTTGSTFNMITITSAPYLCIFLASSVSAVIAIAWAFIAIFVGKTYTKTITSNQVIGKSSKS